MFGSKKTKDVRLTKKEIEELKKNMSRRERKEFERRQREAEMERFDDAVMWGMIFGDDEW